MKRAVYIIIYIIAGSSGMFAQNDSFSLVLNGIQTHIAEERINPLNHPFISVDIPGFTELTETVARMDPSAVAQLIETSPDIQVQAVIVFAAQKLSPRDYLNVVEKIVELGINKKLPYEIVSTAIAPVENLPSLLVDNYQDQQVKKILIGARTVFQDKPRIQEGIDTILSGEAKKDLDRRRQTAFPEEARPKPPIRLDGTHQ